MAKAKPPQPWEQYKVGKPSTEKNWTNPDYQSLETVDHVAHIETAIRIIKDGGLRAGLVFDKSCLNTERILVNWLSPNDWAPGYRYGNIAFTFAFKDLIEDKRFYWVEAMKEYKPHACRILLTSENYDTILPRYNPTKGNGPWFYDAENDEHFWNGNYCLEFMHEGDLPLSGCKQIDFKKHHDAFCNIDPASCPDKGMSANKASIYFISSVLASDLPVKNKHFVNKGRSKTKANDILKTGVYNIKLRISKSDFTGTITAADPLAQPMVRAALYFLSNREFENAHKLASEFKGINEFQDVLHEIIGEKFKITDLTSLNDDW